MTELLEQPAVRENLRVMRISEAVDLWLGELAIRNKRPRTLAAYRGLLDKLDTMYPHIDVGEVTEVMLRRYAITITHHHRTGAPLDTDTQGQRLGVPKRFFEWLKKKHIIDVDPAEWIELPGRKNPITNDKVVTISSAETARMLEVAARDKAQFIEPWDRYRKLLCLAVLAYTGGRRHAVSQLTIADYNAFADPPTLTFGEEKGGKHIVKPISARLAELLREAWLAGVWDDRNPKNPEKYLIPPRATPRSAERDDRIVWKLVKEVAADAQVRAHTHALRAAFAVFFIESGTGDKDALQDHLGHSDGATTQIYLRRLDRQKNMAGVVDLDWGQVEVGGPPGQDAAPSVTEDHV